MYNYLDPFKFVGIKPFSGDPFSPPDAINISSEAIRKILESQQTSSSDSTEAPLASSKIKMEIEKFDDYNLYKFELPGVGQDNIDIELNNNTLVVTAEKALPKNFRTEFYYGVVKRSVSLSKYADIENISAKYVDGVLIVTVPNLQKAPKKVKVNIE